MTDTKIRISENIVEDGRNDAKFSVNGEPILIMPEKGYSSIGWTFEQAQDFIRGVCDLFLMSAELARMAKESSERARQECQHNFELLRTDDGPVEPGCEETIGVCRHCGAETLSERACEEKK